MTFYEIICTICNSVHNKESAYAHRFLTSHNRFFLILLNRLEKQ